jgi:zinc transport system permease protein
MTAVTLKAAHRADTFIGVLWAVGMAVGVILVDLTPGYNVDLMSYLFGSILAVPFSEILWMAAMGAVTLGLTLIFYRDLIAISYDPEFARLRGVPVYFLYFLFMALTAVAIVVIIRVVGLLLVIAMLSIPPYIAEKYANCLGVMMVISVALSVVFNIAGLWAAYCFNLSSGAAIILVAATGFFISALTDCCTARLQKKHRSKK